MAKKQTTKEKAIKYFYSGFNCAEAVIKASLEKWGIKNEEVERAGTVFGRGIGGFGDICGAATGALLIIGIKYGKVVPYENRTECYKKGHEFMKHFEKRLGETECKKLKAKAVPCIKCVGTAMEILEEMNVI